MPYCAFVFDSAIRSISFASRDFLACASHCGKADPPLPSRYETEGSEASFDDEDDSEEDEEAPGIAYLLQSMICLPYSRLQVAPPVAKKRKVAKADDESEEEPEAVSSEAESDEDGEDAKKSKKKAPVAKAKGKAAPKEVAAAPVPVVEDEDDEDED
jgi:hypothetical protein